MALHSGITIGVCEIVAALCSGGMGEVCRGRGTAGAQHVLDGPDFRVSEGWRREWESANEILRNPMNAMVSRSSLATATI